MLSLCDLPGRTVAVPRGAAEIDAIMESLPPWQRRWCGIPCCECSGCAVSLVSRDEWLAWFIRHRNLLCDHCYSALHRVTRDGRTELACEVCDVAWA